MDLPEPPRPDLRPPPPPPKPSPARKGFSPTRGQTVAIIIVSLVFLGIIANALDKNSSGSDDSSDKGGIDPGLGTQDASGDVSVSACDTSLGLITCDVTIQNHSDGRSDYYIEATIENPSGDKVGTANTYVPGVEGGQTAHDTLTGSFSGAGNALTVRLTEVQRTAS